MEPRDVLARARWRRLAEGYRVFLDARAAVGMRFMTRFPTIAAACHAASIDPATAPIPLRPAAHYHMGGIAVDDAGRTSVDGLWGCGEVAPTGLHGATGGHRPGSTDHVGRVGVVRDRTGLCEAIEILRPIAVSSSAATDAAAVGLMIATAALLREESRGGHFRGDFPRRSRLSIE
jgi:L-aspartate oxidase